jgi:kynurenine 3-monooxygenase
VRLAQIGFPWQYNQDSVGKFFWTLNFFLRMILNRLLPFMCSPPAFLMIQDHQLQYQEILAKANRSTQIIYLMGLLAIAGICLVIYQIIH